MDQNPYLPSGDTQKALWLQNFALDKTTIDSVHNDRFILWL